ncbi:MAG: sulfite exporter TauE/SafE family protein [Actinobacteria bacterium]|nr:sulfite exporter TauE/SafE family protein [Actinomycetota bacterium]
MRAWLPLLAGGLSAGMVAGLFGVGGGFLFVAVLVFGAQLRQAQAHATALVAVALAASAAGFRFGIDDAIVWPGALALAAGAIAGARLGSRYMPRISESALLLLLVVVLAILSIRFLLVGGVGGSQAGSEVVVLDLWLVAAHLLGGLFAGVLSSLTGAGGGFVYVPLLVVAFGYQQHVAEGTSLGAVVPTALAGATGHHRHGYTDWAVGSRLGLGSILGGLAGAQIALALPADVLARLFGVFQAILAVLFWRRRTRRAKPHGEVAD